MAQFLLTDFLGLPTLGSIISDISSTILQILVTVRTELHRHPAVATLSTYIHWKMEDNHTYHNRQVHDNNLFYNCFICFNVSTK